MKQYYFIILSLVCTLLFNTKTLAQTQTYNDSNNLDYYKEQLQLYKEKNDNQKILEYQIKIGTTYWHLGQNKNALQFLNQAEKLANEIGNWQLQIKIDRIIADIYKEKKDYKTAAQYGMEALSTARDFGSHSDIAIELINVSQLMGEDYRNSIDCLKQAAHLADEIPDTNLLTRCYLLMSVQYNNAGNHQKATEYKNIADDIAEQQKKSEINGINNNAKKLIEKNNRENQKKLDDINNEKKLYLDSLEKKELMYKNSQLELQLSEQKILTDSIKIKQQQTEIDYHIQRRNLFVILFVFLLIILIVVLFSLYQHKKLNKILQKTNSEIINKNKELNLQTEEIKRQRTLLEIKNNNIVDSINCASKMQNIFLPSQNSIAERFPESFILFMPKEIINNNFYWFTKNENYTFVAVANCTSNSLSGAFMCMAANTLLSQIINRKNIYQPQDILYQINQELSKTTPQKDENKLIGNSIEITICRFNNTKNEITIASANQTAFITQNNNVEQIDGDIYSIGVNFNDSKNIKYHQTTINYTPKTNVYLTTNGYCNQTNQENTQKYQTENLKNLISGIKDMPMLKQYQIIKKEHFNWRGKSNQSEDILIIGITL